MAEDDSFAERTEQATAKRRADARKKGQVARSHELPSILVMITGLAVLFFGSFHIFNQLSVLTAKLLKQTGTLVIEPENIQALIYEIGPALLIILGPVFLGVMGIAILSNYAQVGSLFSTEAIRPDFSRVNPIKGLTRMFSRQAAMELFKSIIKIVIIGWAAYITIRNEGGQILALGDQEINSIFHYMASVSAHLFFKTVLVMLGLAALDYAFQRWSHEKSLRMTKREVQEEYKQTEGDPLIKSRIRSIQREMARRRMMAEVPKADVIITNPTHLAVALEYKYKEMAAPKVVAKGSGFVAEKIREVARGHQIPLVENKPLAQALYKSIDVGQNIPSSLYQAVADILAYVYRMKGKAS